jgi:hydrogenase maturation protease
VPLEDISLAELLARPVRRRFTFPATETREPIPGAWGQAVGHVVRRQRRVVGEIELSADLVEVDLCRLRCRVANLTAWAPDYEEHRETALLGSLISAHTILTLEGGEFVSLLDPPRELHSSISACRNLGTWPVLAGEPGKRNIMLSAPIIVSDYPALAPESAGDLFDGTEIDEILTLRILTLTDEEKREMAQSDERARAILERTEALSRDQLMRMHGTMRPVGPDRK